MQHEIIKKLISEKKYNAITEYVSIVHQNNRIVNVEPYGGSIMRIYKESDDSISIMVPNDIIPVQENALANAISTGTIFDDADNVDNNAKYIEMRMLPMEALSKQAGVPNGMHQVVGAVMGTMNNETGRAAVTPIDQNNGAFAIKDIMQHKDYNVSVPEVVDHYLGEKNQDETTPKMYANVSNLKEDLKDTEDVTDEDELNMTNYDEVKFDEDKEDKGEEEEEDENDEVKDEDEDDVHQESFFHKKPKKLKPITRDIIAYITCEINAIKTPNDQAMLSGYTCSKLELVDFYLNILETDDARYIVPHTKDYLVNMQTELNKLLARILNVIPVNRSDRVWIKNVNTPDSWR